MFALRCAGISLALFFLVYLLLSLLVASVWRRLLPSSTAQKPGRRAHQLFLLRILPLTAAIAVTILFTLPSFLLLEPPSADEPVGAVPLLLASACIGLFAAGMYRALQAHRRTSQAVTAWLNGATVMDSQSPVPIFCTGKNTPTLTVAGVCAPRVLVSRRTLDLLSRPELRTALRHEMAHVRRRDNLRKLLFCLSVSPAMRELESAWSEAAEMAADDDAVSTMDDALDLAAALIKLSRVSSAQSVPALATALACSSTASLNARVQRLYAWQDPHPAPTPFRPWTLIAAACTSAACLWVAYPATLAALHELTEWLVR